MSTVITLCFFLCCRFWSRLSRRSPWVLQNFGMITLCFAIHVLALAFLIISFFVPRWYIKTYNTTTYTEVGLFKICTTDNGDTSCVDFTAFPGHDNVISSGISFILHVDRSRMNRMCYMRKHYHIRLDVRIEILIIIRFCVFCFFFRYDSNSQDMWHFGN